MRKIRDILRLREVNKLSQDAISRVCGISRSTVRDYLMRLEKAGLTWPLHDDLTEEVLEAMLFTYKTPPKNRPLPDWKYIHQELKRKGVTLQLLWQEYQRTHLEETYQYSWFVQNYRQWAQQRKIWMPQARKAGEELHVDYAGKTMPIIGAGGVIQEAEIFVAALPASHFTYCQATPSQQLMDWIDCHCQAFKFIAGVPELLVPDNLRAGVTHPHRYEPIPQRTYEEMATHYGCAIMPARVRHPTDKSPVESAVNGVTRWVLAPLRDRTFFSIDELNTAIRPLLAAYNERAFQNLPGSRKTAFERIEQPALKPLPPTHYEYAEWFEQRASGGCFILIYDHRYSVPYQHAHQKITARVTSKTVECFYRERRVACHARQHIDGRHSIQLFHLSEAHRHQADCNEDKMEAWAKSIGPATHGLIGEILTDSHRHIKQRVRRAVGILRLSKSYGESRLEGACRRANTLGTKAYESILSILKNGLDRLAVISKASTESGLPSEHEHVRGADYYVNVEKGDKPC